MFSFFLRVASYSDANKMPVASLAKVFGPTIVGHGSANPEPSVMWQDTQKQPKVIKQCAVAGWEDVWRYLHVGSKHSMNFSCSSR